MRRDQNSPIRRCEPLMMTESKRGRGRPKKYWGEVIKQDLTLLGLIKDMTLGLVGAMI